MADAQIQQALIYGMIAMSAVDRQMSNAELQKIGSIVRQLPVFGSYDDENLIKDSQACGEMLSGENGLDRLLDFIGETVPKHLYETAYALAVEVAAADLRVKLEEIRFLELLAHRLGLDNLIVVAIERGARARYQRI